MRRGIIIKYTLILIDFLIQVLQPLIKLCLTVFLYFLLSFINGQPHLLRQVPIRFILIAVILQWLILSIKGRIRIRFII